MKKTILVFMCLSFLLILSSCGKNKFLPEYENEYFKYAVRTNDDGTKKAYLIGFTELGLQQEVLVLPNQIENIPIDGIGYETTGTGWMWENTRYSNFRSETLKKLYIPFNAEENEWFSRYTMGELPNCRIIDLGNNKYRILDEFSEIVTTYHDFKQDSIKSDSYHTVLLANISFMYNYDNAPNNGCYWIDSYDNEIISFIPENPTRENYTFDGWYKEKEFINKWDFEIDMTGDEIILTGQDFNEYPGIYLYAKWTLNN